MLPEIVIIYFDWQIQIAKFCGFTCEEQLQAGEDIIMSPVMGADMTFADLAGSF